MVPGVQQLSTVSAAGRKTSRKRIQNRSAKGV
nr:MAG TPA: hypothetical protein [Caudoviricetes sp.]